MTTWNLEIYNKSQDLTEFFLAAKEKGFYNWRHNEQSK